jgi:hypothetical protein
LRLVLLDLAKSGISLGSFCWSYLNLTRRTSQFSPDTTCGERNSMLCFLFVCRSRKPLRVMMLLPLFPIKGTFSEWFPKNLKSYLSAVIWMISIRFWLGNSVQRSLSLQVFTVMTLIQKIKVAASFSVDQRSLFREVTLFMFLFQQFFFVLRWQNLCFPEVRG